MKLSKILLFVLLLMHGLHFDVVASFESSEETTIKGSHCQSCDNQIKLAYTSSSNAKITDIFGFFVYKIENLSENIQFDNTISKFVVGPNQSACTSFDLNANETVIICVEQLNEIFERSVISQSTAMFDSGDNGTLKAQINGKTVPLDLTFYSTAMAISELFLNE